MLFGACLLKLYYYAIVTIAVWQWSRRRCPLSPSVVVVILIIISLHMLLLVVAMKRRWHESNSKRTEWDRQRKGGEGRTGIDRDRFMVRAKKDFKIILWLREWKYVIWLVGSFGCFAEYIHPSIRVHIATNPQCTTIILYKSLVV